MEKYDVAIIGGGVAGLSLAKFLTERDIPSILFEEHNDFFKKACGEAVIRKTIGHDFYDLYGSKNGIEKEIFETIIHTKYGDISLEMPVVMTNKKEIEAELARQARMQSEIKMGEKVEKIEDGILYPQKIKPKIIVGADGVFSLVRNYLGGRNLSCGIAAKGYSIDINLDPNKCHVILKDDMIKCGYAWYFPKKDTWNIGIGCSKKSYFKKAFSQFKEKHNAKGWKGSFIPLNKPIKSFGKNTILVGDAAAHLVAFMGEGIIL